MKTMFVIFFVFSRPYGILKWTETRVRSVTGRNLARCLDSLASVFSNSFYIQRKSTDVIAFVFG